MTLLKELRSIWRDNLTLFGFPLAVITTPLSVGAGVYETVTTSNWFVLTFRQRAGLRSYHEMYCPRCRVGMMTHAPEAPGSLAGKICKFCNTVWAQNASDDRLIIHPYIEIEQQ